MSETSVRGFSGLFGQGLDLGGDDPEAASMHTRACGLDRSVEGKEVGLDRDFLAELDDLIDPVGLSAERSHHGGSLGDGLPHAIPYRERLRRGYVTLLRRDASATRLRAMISC